jgi:hypothetical protein
VLEGPAVAAPHLEHTAAYPRKQAPA